MNGNKKKFEALKKRKNSKQSSFFQLHPETKRWIVVVLLFAFAGISILGFWGLAGSAGVFIDQILVIFLGWAKYFFPVLLLIFGYALLDKKYQIKTVNYIGYFFFILSFTGLLHLFVSASPAAAVLAIDQGNGGGYLGLFLSTVFLNLMGFWAGLIALVAIFIISLLMVINTSFEDIKNSRSLFGRILQGLSIWYYNLKLKLGSKVENDDEEYEDDVAEEVAIKVKAASKDDEAKLAFATKRIEPTAPPKPVQEEIKLDEPTVKRVYHKIDLPLDLLDSRVGKPTAGNIAQNKLIIQRTLESFNIPVEMGDVAVGPTVTQYTLKPAEGVKLSRITALSDDLALALAAHPLRLEAPIPGKSLVGIEVPNQSVAIVHLHELLQSPEFKKRKTNLTLPIGRDVAGNTWVGDLAKMPHVLVAGQTGSGKSVCLHTIIISLLYQNGPDTLKMIMVDPKRVEMPAYNDIPHLLTPVITDLKKTVNALKWTLAEMDRRYQFLEKFGKRNIIDYNAVAKEKIPYIVFIVDEMADLMATMGHDVESLIIRLAQMARAVGIHLILATQRPSVEVITGLIKANVPSRIAFAVASITDSRTILDYAGAEKLIGRGDMLYTCAELAKPKRLQGAFVADDEVGRVVAYLKKQGDKPDYDVAVVEKQNKYTGDGVVDFSDPDQGDELFEEAKQIIVQAGKASTSYLQRRLKVGYSRAARLMDLLEEAGVVGPSDGAKPREILITSQEVEEEGLESQVLSSTSKIPEPEEAEYEGEVGKVKEIVSENIEEVMADEEDDEEIAEDEPEDFEKTAKKIENNNDW